VLRHSALLIVQLLSAAYLLRSAAFLAIWFLVIWLVIRWDTQRRIMRSCVAGAGRAKMARRRSA